MNPVETSQLLNSVLGPMSVIAFVLLFLVAFFLWYFSIFDGKGLKLRIINDMII